MLQQGKHAGLACTYESNDKSNAYSFSTSAFSILMYTQILIYPHLITCAIFIKGANTQKTNAVKHNKLNHNFLW